MVRDMSVSVQVTVAIGCVPDGVITCSCDR